MKLVGMHIRPAAIVASALLVPLASVVFLFGAQRGIFQLLSEKDLVSAWSSAEPASVRPLFYLDYLPLSASYYSRGHAIRIDGAGQSLPADGFWLAVHRTQGRAPAWNCSLQLRPERGIFDLYLCPSPPGQDE
jgi:hypothetical protein